jgi:hypothetical protein
MRYYTVPSVREARESVSWSLFFIFLLYFTAPALAVLAKFEVYTVLVNTPFANLPEWIARWSSVDASLLSVVDVNKDGILQLAEISIGGDIIVLATPEIGGLPYVVSGMVAAGGLAAALSTADGLLLTIANALSHDLYYKVLDPNASTARRVMVSKSLLLVVALAAAYEALGGKTMYFGKPHPPIYDLARRRLAALGAKRDPQILCIGDGIATDVQGGMAEGLDTLFVTGGICAAEFGPDLAHPDKALLKAFLTAKQLSATYSIATLR